MSAQAVSSLVFPEVASSYAVVVDGVFRPELSQLAALPQGVYVGSASGAPPEATAQMVGRQWRQSSAHGASRGRRQPGSM